MLKKIRHLSEGHFYGLHVTNKAKTLSLNKEIRNINSCKQAQSHVYRKEKRDLLDTLDKLHRRKDEHHLQVSHEAALSQRRKSTPFETLEREMLSLDKLHRRKDEHHPQVPQEAALSQRRKSSPYQTLDREMLSLRKLFSENLKTDKVSVDSIAVSSAARKSVYSLNNVDNNLSQLPIAKEKQEVGSVVHRTTGYTNCCVVCNLPRHAHGFGHQSEAVCKCHHGMHAQLQNADDNYHQPGAHVHAHMHRPEDNFFQPDDAFQQKSLFAESGDLSQRSRKQSLDIPDSKSGLFDSRQNREHGKSPHNKAHTELAKPKENIKTASPAKLENKESGAKGYTDRSRGNSIEEDLKVRKSTRQVFDAHLGQRSRKSSLEEQSSGLQNGHRDRSRRTSIDYNSDQFQAWSNSSSRRGSLEERSRYQSLKNAYNKYTQMVTRRGSVSGNIDSRDSMRMENLSDLPYKSIEDQDEDEDNEDQVFQGLVHPDNIINHHYFLPHEANKSNKKTQNRKHGYLEGRNQDYRYHDYQNQGYERRERSRAGSIFEREKRGSFGHVAALFDRTHENEASNVNHSRDMLMKLRQMLQVYHEMESEQTRYPWPRPSVPEFTAEDYQKLKSCRYLRIPQSHQNLTEIDKNIFGDHSTHFT